MDFLLGDVLLRHLFPCSIQEDVDTVHLTVHLGCEPTDDGEEGSEENVPEHVVHSFFFLVDKCTRTVSHNYKLFCISDNRLR